MNLPYNNPFRPKSVKSIIWNFYIIGIRYVGRNIRMGVAGLFLKLSIRWLHFILTNIFHAYTYRNTTYCNKTNKNSRLTDFY